MTIDNVVFALTGKGSGGGGCRGLYPLTAMMNSSCSPNTQNSIGLDLVCTVRAARPIKVLSLFLGNVNVLWFKHKKSAYCHWMILYNNVYITCFF